MMKLFALFFIICLTPMVSYSQENEGNIQAAKKEKEYKHNIGASVGYIAGPGISYRYWINRTYGIQASLLPSYNKNDYEKETKISFGVMGLRMIDETKLLNLFAYAGARLQYRHSTFNVNDVRGDEFNENILNIGGGPGIELKLNRLGLNVMTGIRGMTNFKENQQINVTIESCLYYRF
ncbi:MAG: hypothetical protein ACYC9O_08275 [Candidatus Latescibacterota bacterium]